MSLAASAGPARGGGCDTRSRLEPPRPIPTCTRGGASLSWPPLHSLQPLLTCSTWPGQGHLPDAARVPLKATEPALPLLRLGRGSNGRYPPPPPSHRPRQPARPARPTAPAAAPRTRPTAALAAAHALRISGSKERRWGRGDIAVQAYNKTLPVPVPYYFHSFRSTDHRTYTRIIGPTFMQAVTSNVSTHPRRLHASGNCNGKPRGGTTVLHRMG